MYLKGHLGVALAVYAPAGAWLLLADRAETALLGGVAVLALTMVPDCDTLTDRIDHRGPTHSLTFALLTGLLLGTVATLLAPGLALELAAFAFAVGVLAVVSHLLADVLTPMGVRPFWPLWDRTFSLELTYARDPVANYLLLGFGTGVAALAGFVVSLLG